MRQEANRFSQQDSVEVKLIQSRNQAELMLYVAEYDLSPSETQRSILEGLMANVKSHLADQSPEQLIAQMYALQVHMEKITGKKYILERGIFLDDL
jgi:molecular chaperone DnaK (HSP70)